MRLNRIEFTLMNNPLRAAVQRRFEAPRLLRMGGPLYGGTALELGCGGGVGTELILDLFGADRVDAFDLDPRMIRRAHARLPGRGHPVRLWVGDATAIATPDEAYDAVFDFGMLHHISDWRRALVEVHRVMKPGARFYAEEALAPVIRYSRYLLRHPQHDRFDAGDFGAALESAGLEPIASRELGHALGWFVARKTR
jgi:ubiquinone/menaquinone biosynthesis C-methylase UbiE